MRNFKKRIVSFVSAIALAATMLPGAELIASAADTVLSFNKNSGDFDYESQPNESGKYSGWVHNCEFNKSITSKSDVDFTAGTTYEITLEAAVERDDNKVYHMPTLIIGGDTVGTYPNVAISNKNNPTSTYDNGQWANSYNSTTQYFEYTKKLYYTPSTSGSKTINIATNESNKKDRIHYGTLTIAESDYTVVAKITDFSNFGYNDNTYATFNLDGYSSGKVVVENCSGKTGIQVELTDSNGNNATTLINNGNNPAGDLEYTFTAAQLSDLSTNHRVRIKGNSGTYSVGGENVPQAPTSVKVLATGGSAPESSSQGESSYTITTAASPAAGGTVTGGGSYASGSSVTLTATAKTGYTFTKWQKDGVDISGATNATYTIASVAAADAGTYTAVFTQDTPANNYTVNFSGTNGTVTATANGNPINSGASVAEGTEVTFTASPTPGSGYEFTEWNDGNTTNPRTVTVNANTTMTATFTAQSSGEVLITSLTSSESGGGRHTLGTVDFTNYTNVRFEMTSTNTQYGFNRLYINGKDHYFGDKSSLSGKLDGTDSYTNVTGLSDVLFEFQGHPTTTITFYGVKVGGGEDPVTYPQTVNAIEDSAINPDFTVIYGDSLGTNKYFVENNYINVHSKLSAGTRAGLPFYIDDTSADVTYTISVYLKGDGDTWACIFNGATTSEIGDGIQVDGSWTKLDSEPAVFTLSGNAFPRTGTYYAGFTVSTQDSYINLLKVVVEKSGGSQAEVEYEVVGPYRSGTVSASGTTLTATPRSEYQFVGWYDNEACTGNALSTSLTYPYNGTKVYAKFDYVKYSLPIIDIKTSGSNGSYSEAWLGGKTKKTKYNGSAITLANSSYNLTESTVQIKGRGNSTWALEKKPFEINFDNAVNLFNQGKAANKTWILLANHADRTLMRNQLAYTWARSSLNGIPFTTGATPVEVYMNGDYIGMYIVVEKSRVAEGRVDIDVTSETTSDMAEIGFLAEWDKLAEKKGVPQEDYYIKTNVAGFSEFFTLHSGVYTAYENGEDHTTSGGNNTNTTAIAIGNYLNAVSAAIMSGDEATIRSYVDMNSFVDMFILQEFTKNPDCGGSSFYMYKDKGADSKLTLGPAWDFDKALGDEIRVTRATDLYINGGDPESNNNKDNVNTWFKSLYGQQWFRDLVIARWHDLRSNPTTNPDNLTDQLDAFYTANANSIDRQRTKWSYDMTHEFSESVFWGDYGLSGSYFNNATTAELQATGLRNWITARIAFLDKEWAGHAVEIGVGDYDDDNTFKYYDNGMQQTIPFVVSNTNGGSVTAHDITVTMDFTGADNCWINVFTPEMSSELQDGFLTSETTTSGSMAQTFKSITNDVTTQKHCIQRSGPFTFVIPKGSPVGTYFAGVSSPTTYTKITVRYVDDDYVDTFGAESEYTFTYAAGANGTVTATYDVNGTPTEVVSGSKLPRGTVVTLTATPDEGYEFRGWVENGSIVSTVSPRTITVNRNVDTTAQFVEEGAVFSLTLTASDHIDSATGNMTKVDTVYMVPQGRSEDYGNLVSVPFYLSEAATVTIDVSARLSGNPDGWTKFELFDINGNYLDPAVELVLEAGNEARDSSKEKIYTFSANLPAGAYRFGMYGKEWDSFRQVTLSTEEPNLLSLEAPVGAALDTAPIFKVNKDAYGYTSKAKAGDTYYVDEKVTAVAREGYMFVNWSILHIDDEGHQTIIPLHEEAGFGGINDRSKNLYITSAMAGRIIYANFGEKQSIRYEAESFVKLVSEGYVIPKQTLTDQGVPKEEWVEHKMTNAEFYGRTWDKHPDSHPYDAPKVVRDGESRVKYPDEAKPVYQVWDNSDYTAHKIVTSGYSGGKAVALTGPTSGVAIPFSLTHNLSEDLTFALGYNYGDMPTNYHSGTGDSTWQDPDLYVNIYSTATLTDAQKNALKAHGWSLSQYATPDQAGDTIIDDAHTHADGLQAAFYKRLPINSLNWQTNNNDDPRENVQETEVTLPAGLPKGKYYVSVATDHANLFYDDAAGRKWECFGDANEGNYTNTGKVGTAYYDYIEFYTASTPDMPSPITVGANFIFDDMFGNSLMTNEFREATFDEQTSQIQFHPVVPRYLQVQGYKIDYWMYTVDGVTTYVLPDGSTSKSAPTLSDLDSFDTNVEFNILAEAIENLAFAQGSVIRFTAHYVVKNDVYDMTVAKGRVYVMEDEDDDSPELLPKGNVYKISNYGIVKLVANADSTRDGKFQYWTLNGQIYSYSREVIFSAWCNADFVAVFDPDNGEQVATPAAFISENVQQFGFSDNPEVDQPEYQKVSFDCAFYIPDANNFLSCGILVAPDEGTLNALTSQNVTLTEYGTFASGLPTRSATYTAEYDQLFEKANHQVIFSLSGIKRNKHRYARAFYIYKDASGNPQVAFSGSVAHVLTGTTASGD